jgi:hypothetical protein
LLLRCALVMQPTGDAPQSTMVEGHPPGEAVDQRSLAFGESGQNGRLAA